MVHSYSFCLDCLLNLTHTRPYNHSRLGLRSYAVSEVCVLGLLLNCCALSLYIFTDISKKCDPLGAQYIYKRVIFAVNCVKTLCLSKGAFGVNATRGPQLNFELEKHLFPMFELSPLSYNATRIAKVNGFD